MSGFTANIPGLTESKPRAVQHTDFIPEINLKVKELPSRALSYPQYSEIKYRPYTFGEVKKASQLRASVKEGFEIVMEGVECSFNKYDLTVADFLYIGLLRKISTIGVSKVMVPYECTKCGNKDKLVIDTDKLEFEDLLVPELPVIAEMSIGDMHFSPITVGQFYKLLEMEKEGDELSILAIQCLSHPYDTCIKYFNQSVGEDTFTLQEVDKCLYHGLKPVIAVCKCSNKIKLELDGGSALILPFRESNESPKSRVRFGTKAAHIPNRP